MARMRRIPLTVTVSGDLIEKIEYFLKKNSKYGEINKSRFVEICIEKEMGIYNEKV